MSKKNVKHVEKVPAAPEPSIQALLANRRKIQETVNAELFEQEREAAIEKFGIVAGKSDEKLKTKLDGAQVRIKELEAENALLKAEVDNLKLENNGLNQTIEQLSVPAEVPGDADPTSTPEVPAAPVPPVAPVKGGAKPWQQN